MAIILRVDVDKPYGKHTLLRRIVSKLKEDYFPDLQIKTGYLSHLKEFIRYCNDNSVRATFYHRLCTAPDESTRNLQLLGGHEIGLHLENSRSLETFQTEFNALKSLVPSGQIRTFSKHGSGVYKLGKYHFPKYEPDLYLRWAPKIGCSYPSGNGIAKNCDDLWFENGFTKNVFWMEPSYRHPNFSKITDLLSAAEKADVVVLIHPCNYIVEKKTKKDFHLLIKLAAERNISWKLFP